MITTFFADDRPIKPTSITTIVTDSPHSSTDTSMLVGTLASLARVPGLSSSVRLVFDGGLLPRNFPPGSSFKCQQPVNLSAYASYKAHARQAVMQLPMAANLAFVELTVRGCLSGTVRAGVTGVTTRYVAVIQNDLPLQRSFSLRALLALMDTNPEVQKVSFSAGRNMCYVRQATITCRRHRRLGRASNFTTFHSTTPPITAVQFWSDGNHVATMDHYRHVLKVVHSGSFMEANMFCLPWKNHSAWGTYLLGLPDDGHYSSHVNARNMSFSSNPCMNN